MVKGEAIYKTSERVAKYGMEAYAKMRGFSGKRALKEVERLKKLYPTSPVSLEPKASYISRSQRSYWKDVKALAKERKIGIKESRTLLKKEKTGRNVQVRVIKSGNGWQFILFGKFEHWSKEEFERGEKNLETKHEIKKAYGGSYFHEEQDYEEMFGEAEREAKSVLGGTGWMLIKVLKETWIRFYGREIERI